MNRRPQKTATSAATRAATRAAALGLAAGLGLALGGCGVPTGGPPEALSTTSAPFRLLTDEPVASTAPGTTPSGAAGSRLSGTVTGSVAFVVDDEDVRLQRRIVRAGAPTQEVQALLEQLMVGPTEAEHDRGLGSALLSGAGLRATALRNGLVEIDLAGELPVTAPDRVAVAVGQIVLTATSVPGVRRVQLLKDGTPVDNPLADGSLTTRPLTRADYVQMLG